MERPYGDLKHSADYAASLHGAAALLAFSNNVSGEQTCQESKLGCLGELCFKYKDDQEAGRKLVLLQARHCVTAEEINEEDVEAAFGAHRGTFSLAKFFVSFLEAKRTAKADGDTVQQVVLFTNRPLAEGLRRKCLDYAMGHMPKLLEVLSCLPTGGNAALHTIPHNFCDLLAVGEGEGIEERKTYRDELVQWWETEGNVRLDDLKREFHEKLVFAVCQPNVEEVQEAERRLFERLEICEGLSIEGRAAMLKFFRDNFKMWMEERASGSDGEQNHMPWTCKRTEKCLRDAKAHFARLQIEELSEANLCALKKGVSIEVHMPKRFPRKQHVFETQQLTVYARHAAGTKTAGQSVCRLLWAEQLTKEIYDGFAHMKGVRVVIVHDFQRQSPTVDDIRQKMSNFRSLHKIILTNQPGVGAPLQVVQPSDLSEATLARIMSQDILFQGHPLKIQDVVNGMHGLRSLLDPEIVEQLSVGKLFVLGKDVQRPKEPYIVRHLEKIRDRTVFGEEEIDWVPNNTFVEEEVIIEAKKKGYLHGFITAPPGAGKSSLASSMCSRIKNRQPTWWVGMCDLKEHITALGTYGEKRSLRGKSCLKNFELPQLEYDLIWQLFNVDKVEQRLVKDRLMRRSDDVFLIIDSYNDIEHEVGSEFLSFINMLACEDFHVFVTTREEPPEARLAFEGDLEFSVKTLNEEEQQDLLVELLGQKSSISGDPQSLRDHATKLCREVPVEFCANPLHLYMVSEIRHSIAMGSEMTLYELYHEFVQKKLERYWRGVKFCPGTEAEEKKKMEDDLTQIAIWHMLGDGHKWNSDEERALLLKRVHEKNIDLLYGNSHPLFVHESYAEYFLSGHVYENLPRCEEIADFITSPRFYQIRRFLDGRLKWAKNLQIHQEDSLTVTEDDFLLTPVREGLENLSLYVWKYHKFFSDETKRKAFNLAVENCLQPVVAQAIQDGIDVNGPMLSMSALQNGLKGSESQQLAVLQTLICNGYRRSLTRGHEPVLHSVIFRGTFPAVLQLLIEQGCDVKDVDDSGRTALHKAAGCGCIQMVDLLVAKGWDVNAVSQSGETALHIAAKRGRVDLVERLIELGCDVNAVDKYGATVLDFAVGWESTDVVRCLIKKWCGVNDVRPGKNTALHIAAREGWVDLVQRLILLMGCDVNAVTQDGVTALHEAAAGDSFIVAQLLIKKECDVNAVTDDGKTALHIAARHGWVDLAKLLIEKECDVNAVTDDGKTALHIAAKHGWVDLAKLLIEKGCDLKAETETGESSHGVVELLVETALDGAPYWDRSEVVDLVEERWDSNAESDDGEGSEVVEVVEGGRDINAVCEEGSEVADVVEGGRDINAVCEEGSEVVDVVEGGRDINAVFEDGETALHKAAQRGCIEEVKLLIEKGCNVNAFCHEGGSALYSAFLSGRFEVVMLLAEMGCDVNAVTQSGFTALHLATSVTRSIGMVEYIAGKGCNINAVTSSGETALHWAVGNSWVEAVRFLIEKGCDTNAVTHSGETALHIAARKGFYSVAQLLLENGCDADAVTPSHETALHLAAAEDHYGLVKLLLDHGCDVKSVTKVGESVLHLAAKRCWGGWVEVVERLVKKGCNVHAATESGETALHRVAANGCTAAFQMLLKAGCDVHAVTHSGHTMLHFAAERSWVEGARLLIDKGCDVNARTHAGETALHKAANTRQRSGKRVIQLLIEKGCDVDAVTQGGETALHLAAANGCLKVVRLLVETGCDVNAVSHRGKTPLHKAAETGNIGIVKMLIDRGCDVNAATRSGETALYLAAKGNNSDVVQFLVQQGGNVHAVTTSGETVLHKAAEVGSDFIVELIIKEGCNVSAKTLSGETVLHKAIPMPWLNVLTPLIENGCDVNAKTRTGETALHLAAKEGYPGRVRLLIDAGSDVNAVNLSGETPLHSAAAHGNVSVVKLLKKRGAR